MKVKSARSVELLPFQIGTHGRVALDNVIRYLEEVVSQRTGERLVAGQGKSKLFEVWVPRFLWLLNVHIKCGFRRFNS